ncbi:MAG: hypothetical protein KatS3mg063_2684 [Tepidiforma sp.]|uniref:hypothetical protein n=1 Tax=Tepidiforma sp. TaxID=2682230 RepID=UPI0021DC2338|nr:hypothetical protein [Tepidiforma sp.]GIV93848.1 MAG: hypothetical protein KatS3mg056_2557 [Chloroflexus sp.]GIW16831.1 MAG: hypothetical protein KatS3mg063_2684 [Tepidiforma sp.]
MPGLIPSPLALDVIIRATQGQIATARVIVSNNPWVPWARELPPEIYKEVVMSPSSTTETPPAKPIAQRLIHFRGPSGAPGCCGAQLFRLVPTRVAAVVVLVELLDNPGASISQSWRQITGLVVQHWRLDPSATRWVRYIPAQRGAPEVFDELQLTWRRHALLPGSGAWAPCSREQLHAWLGGRAWTPPAATTKHWHS